MLKVAVVGCGKIADQHAEHIQYLEGCHLVAACDTEELMSSQFAERYSVEKVFSDVE